MGHVGATTVEESPGELGCKAPNAGRWKPACRIGRTPPGEAQLGRGARLGPLSATPSRAPRTSSPCGGQRLVRRHTLVGQRSVRMSQHSGANGLQTGPRASTPCTWGQRWNITRSAPDRHTLLAYRGLPVQRSRRRRVPSHALSGAGCHDQSVSRSWSGAEEPVSSGQVQSVHLAKTL